MARKLSVQQKNLLKKYPHIMFSSDLPMDIFMKLEKMNDYETIWHDVNRYLSDNYHFTSGGTKLKAH